MDVVSCFSFSLIKSDAEAISLDRFFFWIFSFNSDVVGAGVVVDVEGWEEVIILLGVSEGVVEVERGRELAVAVVSPLFFLRSFFLFYFLFVVVLVVIVHFL